MSADPLIVVPFGVELLALTQCEFQTARKRAAELGIGSRTGESQIEPLVDAERMGELAGVPGAWIAEAARQDRIPSIRLGKYVRFRPSAVLASQETRGAIREHHKRKRRNGGKNSR